MFGWLFGGSKAAENTIDGIKKGVDALVFTDQEKATMNQDAFKLWIEYQKATQPQNLARRLIALVVVFIWAIIVLSAAVVGIIGLSEQAQYLMDLLFKTVMPSVVVIISFYFYKRIKSDN